MTTPLLPSLDQRYKIGLTLGSQDSTEIRVFEGTRTVPVDSPEWNLAIPCEGCSVRRTQGETSAKCLPCSNFRSLRGVPGNCFDLIGSAWRKI